MSFDQIFLLGLLVAVFVLFLRGPWRYDVVAFLALIAATAVGTIPWERAFLGFGHPAVITVAAVLIISRGLRNAGAVDLIARHMLPPIESASRQIGLFSSVAGGLSAMMNNVGALALMMPAALQSAAKVGRAPGTILMPLSFGSILGGMVTLIGTPPNIIVATFRAESAGAPFGMFDFTPVGATVAVLGIAFIALVGWRLIPRQRRAPISSRELFDVEEYLIELRVPGGSRSVGEPMGKIDHLLGKQDAVLLGLLRGAQRIPPSRLRELLRADDVLIVEAGAEDIESLISDLQLKPAAGAKKGKRSLLGGQDIVWQEAVVPVGSRVIGRTPGALRLLRRHAVSLLAVSRQGRAYRGRLRNFTLRAGDVLLLQGDADRLPDAIAAADLLPLAERGLQLGTGERAGIAIGIFAAAVTLATVGVVGLPLALAGAAAVMVAINIVPARELYESVDWPVIVLLAAMIPIGEAMQTSGATETIAAGLLDLAAGYGAVVILGIVLTLTMTLSDIMNNAATAVVMAPIAVNLANGLDANPDTFLMAVAVGASCAFLTPIGHQNNTLILGPGGYHFGDYWRLGLPLEILIVATSLPMLLWVWPL
ncbi:MAG: SLC13 family permease [Alphaproteobacteria bacterium]